MNNTRENNLMFEAYKSRLVEGTWQCTCNGTEECAYCKKMAKKDEKMVKTKKQKKAVKGDKVVKEHHESEYDSHILNMTVGSLLDTLEKTDPELYRRLEGYIDEHESNLEHGKEMPDGLGAEKLGDVGDTLGDEEQPAVPSAM